MPRLLITSFTAWTGMAALAAADSIPPAASPAAPVYRSYTGGAPLNSSPTPLMPVPAGTVYGSPSAPYSVPGTYSSQPYYGSSVSTGSMYGPPSSYYTASGSGAGAIYGTPGGYEARIGSPYHYFDPSGGQYAMTGNPYNDHWGPGFHRQSLHGHYRFPYYNYRAPWYYPGRAVYNRDTNFAW